MNHLSDEFTGSTVTSEAAKDSPTVQLVRYLIDAVHSQGSNGAEALAAAEGWLAVADADLTEDDYDDANQPLLNDAAPIIAALMACVPHKLSLHSLVINWNDHDSEEGTFGTTVRAWDSTHAEYLARAEMEVSEGRGYDFTGSVVDHNVGATWMADDLEKSLRELVAACRADGVYDITDALTGAEKLLAMIDNL